MSGAELWKAVPGFEGSYEVANQGRVRSLDRILYPTDACRGYPRRIKGRVLKLQRHSQSYVQVGLGKAETRLVHILVAEAFLPKPPGVMEVCHLDGDRTNNHLPNIAWVSHTENCAHRTLHGTEVRGERNARAKLTPSEVLEIRRRRESGDLHTEIANDFGVSDRTIGKIARNERWRHV